MTIETIRGNLRAVARLVPGTFQDFDELSVDQVADPTLLREAFYVSTFPLYTARDGVPVFALARHTKEHPNNLVLNHLFDKENSSWNQLLDERTGHNFSPDPEEARAVLGATDTLQAKYSDVRLSGTDKVYRFLGIRTADGFVRVGDDYEPPRDIEQAVIQRVGYTEEFLMTLRREHPTISETQLYLLTPDFVTAKAGEGFVGRAAWRGDFRNLAVSLADFRVVFIPNGLRGVRLVVAVPERARDELLQVTGDAPEKGDVPSALSAAQEIGFDQCYDTLLADRKGAVAALTDTRVKGLSQILADYKTTPKQ